MGRVWRSLCGLSSTPLIPLPDEVGIAGKRFGRGQGQGVVVSPESSRSAKSLEATVGRQPGSCDDENGIIQNASPLEPACFVDHGLGALPWVPLSRRTRDRKTVMNCPILVNVMLCSSSTIL